MKQARKVLCIIGVGIIGVFLAVSTVYACCGMDPVITDDPIGEVCLGQEVTISGTIWAYEEYTNSYSTGPVTMVIEVQPPSGPAVTLVVTLDNLQEPDPQTDPPSAQWDFSATYTPTEVGTYTYVKTAGWTSSAEPPWNEPMYRSASGSFEVIVCNQPPDCSEAYADLDCLWPPNNKMVPVSILGVTDPDGDPVTIVITGITSDEATATEKGAAGPKHAPDADGVGTDTASVRAERSGKGNGRVYEISFSASDGEGGECIGSVTVCVPHDQSGECECVDDGQNYDATQIN